MLQLVDLRRQDEVALGGAVDLVSTCRDGGLSPSQQDVGMMSLLFGDGADAVHEIEGLLEIRERERARNVVLVHHCPVRKLMAQIVQVGSLESRHVAAAGNAGLAG